VQRFQEGGEGTGGQKTLISLGGKEIVLKKEVSLLNWSELYQSKKGSGENAGKRRPGPGREEETYSEGAEGFSPVS